jgi:hypothetical protein
MRGGSNSSKKCGNHDNSSNESKHSNELKKNKKDTLEPEISSEGNA